MFQLEILPLEDLHSQQCNRKWKGQVKKDETSKWKMQHYCWRDGRKKKVWDEMTLVYLFLPRDELISK